MQVAVGALSADKPTVNALEHHSNFNKKMTKAQLRKRLTHESEQQHVSPFRIIRFLIELFLVFRWWRTLASTSLTFTRHENVPVSLILVKKWTFPGAKKMCNVECVYSTQ